MPFEASELSHNVGARMIAGSSRFPSAPILFGDGGSRSVSVEPPGSRTFTSSPVPARSAAQIRLAASRKALVGHGRVPRADHGDVRGRDIDDLPNLAATSLDSRPRHQEGRSRWVDNLRPLLRQLPELRRHGVKSRYRTHAQAGVVDQHIHTPECSDGVVYCPDTVDDCDIRRNRQRIRTQGIAHARTSVSALPVIAKRAPAAASASAISGPIRAIRR